MAGPDAFQDDAFQNNAFQVTTTPSVSPTEGFRSFGPLGVSVPDPALVGFVGHPFGLASTASRPVAGFHSLFFWMGGVGSTPIVVTPPTPGPITGVGRAWSDHYRKSSRRKRKLIDELDEQLLELKERIEEQPQEVVKERDWRGEIDRLAAFYEQSVEKQVAIAQIQAQIAVAQALIREMDDEDVFLLLSVH